MQRNIVHTFEHGKPFCGFTNQIVGNWPEGHVGVVVANADQVTCEGCRREIDILKEAQRNEPADSD